MDSTIKRIVELATALVLSRSGDVSTKNGNFATVDDNIIIELDVAISEAFNLDSDEVTSSDLDAITRKLNLITRSATIQTKYSYTEQQGDLMVSRPTLPSRRKK